MEGESIVEKFRRSGGLSRPVVQTLVFRVTGLAFIFLLHVLLARLMGPKNYGDYAVIITLVNLLLVFSLFGFDSSVLRFLPAFVSRKAYAPAHGYIRFSYKVITILAIVCSVAIFVFLLTRSKKFNIAFSEGLFWGMLLLPFLAFVYQASSVLRALGRIKASLLPNYFLFPVVMAMLSAFHYFRYGRLTVDAAMLLNLCCTAVICVYINRKAGKTVKLVLPGAEPEYERKQWLLVSGALFLTTSLDMLLKQSDILMVGYFLGNTKAGFYSVAARLSTLAALGLAVADYIFIPKLAALYESRQIAKLQKMISDSSYQILSISLPIIVVIAAAGKWILELFGSTFTVSYPALLILLLGQLINACTGMVGGLLMMTGNQSRLILFYLIAFVLQFVLNLFLIPLWGITGAAVGTSLGLIALNLIGYNFVRKKMGIRASVL
jgi:O-antigen/teichoic acid export membrane protein